MTKKEIRRSPSNSMEYFLKVYYDLNDELIEKLCTHTHKALKEIAKLYGINLKKMSFEDLTREMVATGEVVLITDHCGNVAPYINPYTEIEDEYETTMDERYISYEVYDLNEGEIDYGKHKGRQRVKRFKS